MSVDAHSAGQDHLKEREESQGEDTWVYVHDLDSMLQVAISGYNGKIPELQFISAYRW